MCVWAALCAVGASSTAQYRLLEEKRRKAERRMAQIEREAAELEQEKRDILNAMRYRELERGGPGLPPPPPA